MHIKIDRIKLIYYLVKNYFCPGKKTYLGKCLEESNRMTICKNISKKRVGNLCHEHTKNDIKKQFRLMEFVFND